MFIGERNIVKLSLIYNIYKDHIITILSMKTNYHDIERRVHTLITQYHVLALILYKNKIPLMLFQCLSSMGRYEIWQPIKLDYLLTIAADMDIVGACQIKHCCPYTRPTYSCVFLTMKVGNKEKRGGLS